MEPLICIGEIYREHGIHGKVRVYLYSGDPENFRPKMKMVLEKESGEKLESILESAVPYQKWFLTKFSVINSPEEAKTWRQAKIWVSKKDLKQGRESYVFELIGFEVLDDQGRRIGTIREIRGAGESALFVVEGAKEYLIPVVPQWIVQVDKVGKKIVMNLPEGLV
ncbi:MAG: ribosome maturation factor RimM [Deltaproteobacteria bacterium]|nr:ribosome maturation factor RimM [Deltaproteobacteria bacterium]